ncbi:hypothetical protein [Prochlorococcus marinus]|nr:hypothetical protein [Prochlorococcus marinus]MBW3042039.1 hypothetical protein [Prochlorococcus marinus str. XMU1408]
MESTQKTRKIWVFVICLNLTAILGAFYLRSIGIDLYAFRGGS